MDYARYWPRRWPIWRSKTARRRRPDRLRRRSPQLHPPSTRQGQFMRLLHGIEQAEPANAHRFHQAPLPFSGIPAAPRHGGRDLRFLRSPKNHRTVEPLRFHGNEVVLFHVLDPEGDSARPEARPAGGHGNAGRLEVTPEYAKNEYRQKMDAHIADLAIAPAPPEWIISCWSPTGLSTAPARISDHPPGEKLGGLSFSLVSRRAWRRSGLPLYLHLLRQYTQHSASLQLADVFRAPHAKLHQAPPPALPAAALAARRAADPARAGVRQSVRHAIVAASGQATKCC
jgi:hypothetical protein